VRDLELGRVRRPHLESVRLLAAALELTEPELAQLELAVRSQPWPASDRAGGQRGAANSPPVPSQLPADVPVFTGRTSELAELDRLLQHRTGSAAIVISAVSGTAGVGKTALALHWAHQVAACFPDGQLYVNLRGYDPDQPVLAAEALAGFLRALGVPGEDVPFDVAERAAAFRSRLAGRRMLVVLDNAAEVEQVRPLLPGGPPCVAVVTSRDSLAGLVALHGACRVDLDLMPEADALSLLRALVGDRVDAEPDAAVTLVAQCARLPLALRVAAQLTAAIPGATLARLTAELADEHDRLARLVADGDQRAAVTSVFSWSYRRLPADAAQLFRRLGLHPGPDFDAYAVAALTDTPLDRTGQLLDLLARAHLVQPAGPGRYGLHDLLRAYAASLVAAEDGADLPRAAQTALLDHYLGTAAAAMDTLYPAERRRRPTVPRPATPLPPMTDQATAKAWLDAERATLAACVHTAADGWPSQATALAGTLFRYLDVGGHHPEALTIHAQATQAARRTGNPAAEAHALTNLGAVHHRQARYEAAAAHYQQALALLSGTGDRPAEARALTNLGNLYWLQGQHEPAAEMHQRALDVARETGDRASELYALNNLALARQAQTRHDEAAQLHQRALDLAEQTGNGVGEAIALLGLGEVALQASRYEAATGYYQRAHTLHQETGDRDGVARALTKLGEIFFRQGRYRQAAEHHEQALRLSQETGDRAGEADALNGLGESLHAAGDSEQAAARHAAALAVAEAVGESNQQARAHHGLGHTRAADGRIDQARWHWQQALAHYTTLDATAADEVRAQLATLAGPEPVRDGTD
jgi:tetratricopeptide (TPR) repeat protein